jgi:SAM-dependent methyltransferase
MTEVRLPPEAADMPDPGDSLIERVTGTTSRAFFYWSGRESALELARTLSIIGRGLDSFESILDFGCGCGRMLLWLEDLGRTRALHGTDIDAEAVEWAREHIPFVTFAVNAADPPLPFDSAAFDLVVNHSVFTHIDAARQDAWLTELRRVIRPGGLAVLSVHGERHGLKPEWAGYRDLLETNGIVFLDGVLPAEGPFPDWYQATLHAPWYIFEHWGRWFEIRGYVPGGGLSHDHVLLERKPDVPPLDTLMARPKRARFNSPRGAADPAAAPTASNSAPAHVSEAPSGLSPAVRAQVDAAVRSLMKLESHPVRHGALGHLARRVVLRLLRPYTTHARALDLAVARALDGLSVSAERHEARIDALERRD